MDYNKLSKNIKRGALNLSTVIFFISLIVSFIVVYSSNYLTNPFQDTPDEYFLFIGSMFGIVMMTTTTIGSIRLMFSKTVGIRLIIGSFVAFFSVNLIAIFFAYVAYAGEQLENIGITMLSFDGVYIVSLLDAYKSLAFFSKWSIVISLCCMMIYYGALLYDMLNAQMKVNDG